MQTSDQVRRGRKPWHYAASAELAFAWEGFWATRPKFGLPTHTHCLAADRLRELIEADRKHNRGTIVSTRHGVRLAWIDGKALASLGPGDHSPQKVRGAQP